MTTYDLTQPARTIKGEPLPDGRGGTLDKPLADFAADALLAEDPQKPSEGSAKLHRFKLADRIASAEGPVELSAKEVTEILDQAAKFMGTLIYGQLARALGEADADAA